MRLPDIIKTLGRIFEKKKKNPVHLSDDSNLESNLKPLKVSDKNTPIEISENTVDVKGSLKVNGIDVSTQLNDLSDVTYSSGDLLISSLDTIKTSGELTLNAVGEIHLQDNSVNTASFGTGDFKLYYDSNNLLRTTVSSSGSVMLISVGGTAADADITIDAGGDITLDSGTGIFIAKKAGTEFSAANSSYAGMILGYTDIGLNETHTTLNLTTSYVVPTDEFSVAFTAPPSGNVLIEAQIQHYNGSTGLGDLYAGLSDANATDGYNQLAAHHESIVNDAQGRAAIDIVDISWTLTGLTAGTDYEYWAGFKAQSTTGTPRLQWGGSTTGRFADFIMKATALPATITT